MTIRDVRWVDFQDVPDDRGRLTAIEGDVHVPFPIARIFYVHQVVPGVDRAGHAHRETDQVLTAVYGRLKVDVSDGVLVNTYDLEEPGRGLYVPRMAWIRLYDFRSGAVCLVLANTRYDRAKSIRTWKEYLAEKGLPWTAAPGEAPHTGGGERA